MIRINLLPKEMIRKEERKGVGLLIVAGSALLLAVMILLYLNALVGYNRAKDDLARVQTELKAKENVLEQVKKLEVRKGILDRKLSAIQALVKTRLNYSKLLTDINLVMAKQVWLNSLSTLYKSDTQYDLTLSATALSNEAIADWIDNLERTLRFSQVDLGSISKSTLSKIPVLNFTVACKYNPTVEGQR